jgi:NADH-quinone oxidoreductase subunit N
LGALYQRRLKRILAYSSISNVGYALGGLCVGGAHGLQAAITHMIFYSCALLVLLVLVYSCANSDGKPAIVFISDFSGLG